MAERRLQLELIEETKDLLVEKGWDPAMGARPLRRAIQRYIEDPLADFVLRSHVPEGSTVLIERDDDWTTGPGDDDEPPRSSSPSDGEPAPKPMPVGVGAEGGSDGGDAVESDADEAPAESTDGVLVDRPAPWTLGTARRLTPASATREFEGNRRSAR